MILAINTASEKNSIALYQQPRQSPPAGWTLGLEKEVVWESYKTQSKELLPKINKLLKDNNLTLDDLTAIAVFQGPGSYTGLRVGITIANTLARSLNIPVIGIKGRKVIRLKGYKDVEMKALEIAKKSEKISRSIKKKEFSKIVVPYYNSQLNKC